MAYKYKYIFKDNDGTVSKLMIEDWETAQLFWNSLRRHDGNGKKACEDVRKKYLNYFLPKRKTCISS